MLDKKTTTVLKVLGKLCEDTAYKVVTMDDILSNIPSRLQYDADGVKQTIDYLCKQEYIVLKFEEDNTFCYSMLPKARISLEQEQSKSRPKKTKFPVWWLIACGLFSGLCSFVAIWLFYYLVL